MTKLLQVLIAAGILSISLFTANVYASENAGCSRDCEAPTLGVTDSGQRVIENGIAINGRTFEVNHQIQTNPTMTITTGNTAKVKLMIYENDGVSELRHASITITDYQDDKNQNDKVLISFDQDFTGAQSFDVVDPDGFVKDVNVKATQLDQWRTEVVYSFKAVKPFDASSIVVEMVPSTTPPNGGYQNLALLPNHAEPCLFLTTGTQPSDDGCVGVRGRRAAAVVTCAARAGG